jgi:uncharacterized protein YggE
VADASVQSSRVGVHENIRHRGGEAVRQGYLATVSLTVAVGDLSMVEPLIVEVVNAGAHTIDGITYHTSRMKELRGRARTEAIHAAKAKAEVYATASDVRVGSVLHIEDINPDQFAYARHGADIDLTPPPENDESPTMEPGSLTISAAVMVAYGID